MMDGSFKLVLKLQTPLGGFQSIFFLHRILPFLAFYKATMPMIDLTSTAIPNPVILSDNFAMTTTFPQLPSLMV